MTNHIPKENEYKARQISLVRKQSKKEGSVRWFDQPANAPELEE